MEESFPRGKKREEVPHKSTQEEDLFKTPKAVGKKRKRVAKLGEEGTTEKKKTDVHIQELSYDGIKEGLLSLGRVSLVRDHEVLVSLPGRTVGSISIKNVSQSYTQALTALEKGTLSKDMILHPLKGMFQEGDLVIVKVLAVTLTDKGHRVSLTTDPKEIHSNWNAILLKPGMVLTGAVESHEEHGYIMDLGLNGTKAFLPSDRAGKFIKSVNESKPIGVGQLVQVKLVTANIHRLMCTTTLSAIPAEVAKVEMTDDMDLNYSMLLPGMSISTMVMSIHKTGLIVHCLGMKGFIHADQLPVVWHTPTRFTIGQEVMARVLYVEPNGTSAYLTLQNNMWPYGPFRFESCPFLGELVPVRINSFEKRGLIVRSVSTNQRGIVPLPKCSDDASWTEEDIAKNFRIGTFHDCRVLSFSSMDRFFIGSFQKKMIGQDLIKVEQVSPGLKVSVSIVGFNGGGAVVSLGYNLKGFIPNSHFPVSATLPKDKYPVGTSLKARVFLVDSTKPQVLITARKKLIRSEGVVLTKYEEATVGMIGHGVIRHVKLAGLQISTIGGLLGFLPASKTGSERIANLESAFHEGQIIEYQVLEVNVKRKQLIFGMHSEATEQIVADALAPKKTPKKRPRKEEDISKDSSSKDISSKVSHLTTWDHSPVSLSGVSVPGQTEEKENVEGRKRKISPPQGVSKKRREDEGALSVATPSFWELADNKEEEEDELTELVEKEAHKAKSTKKNVSSVQAVTVDEHEKRVAEKPNEANLWIDYMHFAAKSGDLNKAREVIHRGIQTMSFRDDKSKLSLWTSLLSLECKYGSEDSLKKELEEAERRNDRFTVLKQMALIYEKHEKFQEAEKIYSRLISKFRTSAESWARFQAFYFYQQKLTEGRVVYEKALKALPSSDHIRLKTSFACLEISKGDVSKGCAIFDQILTQQPKRIDLWMMYVRALMKNKKFEEARSVLNRGLGTKMPPKKMKPFLELFLAFETEHGTRETLEAYRGKARSYFDNVTFEIPT